MKFIYLFLEICILIRLVMENRVSASQSKFNPKKQLQIWNMTLAFGKQYNTKGWILHYGERDNPTWKYSYHKIIKQCRNICYFASNNISDHDNPSRWITFWKETFNSNVE